MAKARNSFERMAADAARRLDQARATGEQLSFLPDEAGRTPAEVAAPDGAAPAKGGRPKGALGKVSSQLRDWLAARGLRMPEQQLAEIAGLASSEGAMMTAMRDAEAVLAWSYATEDGTGPVPSSEQRLSTFLQLYAMQLRAADALMPYGTPKAAPDVNVTQAVQLVVQGGDRGRAAQDVTPNAAPARRGLVPADVQWKIEQKQQDSEDAADASDQENSD